MPEALQSLIDKFQREAAGAGQRQAQIILAEARATAVETVKEAEAKAARTIEQAVAGGRAFQLWDSPVEIVQSRGTESGR